MRRRVRIAVFSTGDEIVEPGTKLPRAALYDSNRYLLAGLIARLGAEVTDLGILKDDQPALARALAAAAVDHDLVLTSGGVSTGEADHVRAAVESIGRLVFWRAGHQARPAGGDGRHSRRQLSATAPPFVGLPGNPVAVFVTFVRVVRPLLLRLAGALPEPLIAIAGARGLLLQEAQGPTRICARRIARRSRRRHRGGQIRAGWRRHPHLAHRNRRLGRIGARTSR